MLLFLVLGFIMMFASPTKILGSVYNSIGAIMVVQLINSVSVSAMVQTSPYKKKLQTIIPALHAGSYLLIINTLNIVMLLVGTNFFEWDKTLISNSILMSSGIMIIIGVYMNIALKFFWPATIVFFIAYFLYYIPLGLMELLEDEAEMILPLEMSIVISYVVVIAGSVLMYVISLAIYKFEYSKITWEAALKRAK